MNIFIFNKREEEGKYKKKNNIYINFFGLELNCNLMKYFLNPP